MVSYKALNTKESKSTFSGNKWTSTQDNATNSYYFGSAVGNSNKTFSYMAIPFYACLSNSLSLLSLSNEGSVSGSGVM